MKTDSGFITCGMCGATVRTSSRPYGGLFRMVCSDPQCVESELGWMVDE